MLPVIWIKNYIYKRFNDKMLTKQLKSLDFRKSTKLL
jgi:hypothetical protein